MTNIVNYAPMMASDEEEKDDDNKTKQNRIRPKPDGPSAVVFRDHATIQNKKQKGFETKPIPVLPVQNRANNKTETENTGNTVPDKDEKSAPPVETAPANDSDTEGYENFETEIENKQPVIGTLVMKTVGIVKK